MSTRFRWAGHVARIKGSGSFTILTAKYVRNRPLARQKLSLQGNMKMNPSEMSVDVMNLKLAQNWNYWRVLMNATLNLH